MTTGYETPEVIKERYQGMVGIDVDVTPPIPMSGMLGWDGAAWEKISSDGSGNLSFTLDSPNSVTNGQKTVTTAGTAEVLAASTTILSVTIKALSGNTGYVYVGSASVDSTNGFVLQAGESISLDIDNLADIYLDVSANGEGVSFIGVSA